MYRNAVYIPREECVRVWGWDELGNRIVTDYTYNPYLYIETTGEGEAKSLFNTPLRKKIFRTQYERYKYTQESGNKRLFENISAVQQFLINRYWQDHEKPEFSKFPLRILYLDIEYEVDGPFSAPDNPTRPVNVLTVFDSLKKEFITWGTGGDYKVSRPNHRYIKCVSERDLLNRFLEYFEHDYPDILSGWNSEFFDIPYLINRTAKLFGDDEIRRFSPIGNVYQRTFMGKFGKPVQKWYLEGVSCLDYLEVYRTFKQGLQESYKLNDIAEAEIGEKKIDYGNVDLGKLAREDWQKFVDYNVQDVHLLPGLENKLMYLELVRMLAYVGLTPFEHSLGTIVTVTGAAVIQAKHQGLIVPTFEKGEEDPKQAEGAFVAEPLRGFQDYVVSFDLNSLYPNTMITLNLSPETKIGVIEEQTENSITIRHVSGKVFKLSPAKFYEFIKAEQISVSKAKVLFTQKKKGIFPVIVDKLYEKRVLIKKDMKACKKQMYDIGENHPDYKALKDKADKLDILQFTVKILINRIYGYFGNKHNPLGDLDISRSITLTGQAVIKESGRILTDWINKKANLTGTPKQVERIVYSDTDSCYISLKPVVDALGLKVVSSHGKATKEFLDMAAEIEGHLNAAIKLWGEEELNSTDCRFQFKRESICDTSIFLEKKRYVLHVLDLEGIPCNKYKYVGVEVVRTTLPKPLKPYVKKMIELMMTSKDQGKVTALLNETYEVFKKLPIKDIARVSGINGYEAYAARCQQYQTCKRMPIHVKAAYIHNLLLKELQIDTKYESIASGDKIRYFDVQMPNKYHTNVIGFKYYYPEEFKNLFEPNYELIFDKLIYSILQRFYEVVKWKLRRPGEQLVTDLFDFLSA